MQITDKIEFSKYKRAFFFGCSFTDYYWPTWADIISWEIPNSFKYAKCGAGNFYIYQAVIEAAVTHNIGKDDLVMVMFSNVTREDRYTRAEGWITPGNLFYQDTYDEKFMKKFFCERGYLMRDLTLIEGIDRILKETEADYSLMSMINLDSYDSSERPITHVEDVLLMYKDTLAKVKPSVFEVVFNKDWNNNSERPKYNCHWSPSLYTDNHPTPKEHLEYLEKTFPSTTFSEHTSKLVRESNWELLQCNTYDDILNKFERIRLIPPYRL